VAVATPDTALVADTTGGSAARTGAVAVGSAAVVSTGADEGALETASTGAAGAKALLNCSGHRYLSCSFNCAISALYSASVTLGGAAALSCHLPLFGFWPRTATLSGLVLRLAGTSTCYSGAESAAVKTLPVVIAVIELGCP
jgi:hypothetical protein